MPSGAEALFLSPFIQHLCCSHSAFIQPLCRFSVYNLPYVCYINASSPLVIMLQIDLALLLYNARNFILLWVYCTVYTSWVCSNSATSVLTAICIIVNSLYYQVNQLFCKHVLFHLSRVHVFCTCPGEEGIVKPKRTSRAKSSNWTDSLAW